MFSGPKEKRGSLKALGSRRTTTFPLTGFSLTAGLNFYTLEWGEWMRETLLLDVPHRRVVFVIPKLLRIFFKYKRRLLGELCRAAVQALLKYFQAVTKREIAPGVVAVIHSGFSVHSQLKAMTKAEAERVGKYMIRPLVALERLSFDEEEGKVCYRYGKEGEEAERMDYLEFIARVTSHIPEKGQVMVRYFGLYANAHRGKVRKSEEAGHKLLIIEEERPKIPRRGWAEMIRKVYEVDPLVCSKCGGTMKVVAFITDFSLVDRIINHLKLSFIADKPPPPQVAFQELLMAAETSAEYFS